MKNSVEWKAILCGQDAYNAVALAQSVFTKLADSSDTTDGDENLKNILEAELRQCNEKFSDSRKSLRMFGDEITALPSSQKAKDDLFVQAGWSIYNERAVGSKLLKDLCDEVKDQADCARACQILLGKNLSAIQFFSAQHNDHQTINFSVELTNEKLRQMLALGEGKNDSGIIIDFHVSSKFWSDLLFLIHYSKNFPAINEKIKLNVIKSCDLIIRSLRLRYYPNKSAIPRYCMENSLEKMYTHPEMMGYCELIYAIVLMTAGIAYRDQIFFSTGRELGMIGAGRNFIEYPTKDARLLGGYSGIGLLLQICDYLSPSFWFSLYSRYWYLHTIAFGSSLDGAECFLTWEPCAGRNKWISESGLELGSTGTALCLLAGVRRERPKWLAGSGLFLPEIDSIP